MRLRVLSMVLFALLTATILPAQRDPVLKQIAHPHAYYFREMYLPQLTSGPSSVTWSPDSQDVIFSMKGLLWRQALGAMIPTQLTHGPGYDYQPDWSRDGRFVVYCKYHHDAIELWLLDLKTNESRQLTKDGAVNVEPRWSPDGSRIAFVSTAFHGYFHIFQMGFNQGQPQAIERLTQETTTAAKRYYYAKVDHEISPSWSPDGSELIFIHNHDRPYGTGGIWRMRAEANAVPRLIHDEETTWRARPDWSPDGKRLVYASYDRRQWHQLWLTTADGGDPIPLTFGEYDNTNPRWSPDGKRIAFISNRNGNTELWFVDALGGKQTQLNIESPAAPKIRIRAPHTRVSVRGRDGRFYGPNNAWYFADDSFVRAEMPEEARYFDCESVCDVEVPPGESQVFIMRGLGFKTFSTRARPGGSVTYPATPLPPLPGGRWVAADVHTHMNYGGTYRNTPEHFLQQAKAEGVNLVFDLVVNKEQRIPDISYFSPHPDKASTADQVLAYAQEYHTSNWGHMDLLGIKDHSIIPGYSTYPLTAAASPYPSNAVVADLAHEQKGLVGYAHIYGQEDLPDPSINSNHELPADVALGKVDYIEVLGFNDHRATAEIWYRLLNLGFRIPAAGGTDAMGNFASLRGPVGLNRTYAPLPPGPIDPDRWLAQLKAGRTFATNGPLLNFTLATRGVGDRLALERAAEVPFTATMRSIVAIDHLEVICNGRVTRTIELTGDRTVADVRGTLPIDRSGWCVLRAWDDQPKFPVLDIYPYGTTSPVYISVRDEALRSPEDAKFFVGWMDHLIEHTEKMPDWNTPAEKAAVLDEFRRAREVFASKR